MLIDEANGARDVWTGVITLHASRCKKHMNSARPSRDDVEDVTNSGTGWRSNNADASRKNRKWTFEFFRKQPFSLQAIAQLFKCDSQRTGAHWIEALHHHLVFTAWWINSQFAPRANM